MHSSDNEAVLGSSRKLGEAAEHLIDGSEKRICQSTFEFQSSHVIEKRSNTYVQVEGKYCLISTSYLAGILFDIFILLHI